MPKDILQAFLDKGLLDLGEGTDKFDFIKSAAGTVTKQLEDDPLLLIQAASVLLGGSVEPDDSINRMCDEAIKGNWPTYRSRFTADTTQLYRATVLQAVVNVVANGDAIPSAIVLYTTSSAQPHIGIEREDQLFSTLLSDLAERNEVEAERIWARPKAISLQDVEDAEPSSTLPAISAKALNDALKSATGPSAGATGANPAWPSATQEWLDFYAKASAEAIVTALATAQKATFAAVIAQTRADDSQIMSRIRDAITGTSAESYRADLLFWKECLYSRARKCGYRALSPDSAVFWMAHDLHEQVPRIHPQSVEYFLREAVRSALGESAATIERSVIDFTSGLEHECGDRTPPGFRPADRLTLLAAARAVASGSLMTDQFTSRTGIKQSASVPRADLAVWLFRDFQARRLVLPARNLAMVGRFV